MSTRLIKNSSGKLIAVGGHLAAISGTVRLRVNPTRTYAYITTSQTWKSASDSWSIVTPVTVGTQYKISFTTTTNSSVGTIFRYGFCDYSDTSSERTLSQVTRTSPQNKSSVTLTADKPYLIVQLSASYANAVISNGRIKIEVIL